MTYLEPVTMIQTCYLTIIKQIIYELLLKSKHDKAQLATLATEYARIKWLIFIPIEEEKTLQLKMCKKCRFEKNKAIFS
jgi:hypothetical protein